MAISCNCRVNPITGQMIDSILEPNTKLYTRPYNSKGQSNDSKNRIKIQTTLYYHDITYDLEVPLSTLNILHIV